MTLRNLAAALALVAVAVAARADDDADARTYLEAAPAAAKERPTRSEGGRWYETADDGKEVLVGLAIMVHGTQGGYESVEDALAIPATEFAGLRTLAIDGFDARLGRILTKVDPARCFVKLESDAEGRLPPLPDGLRTLEVRARLSGSPLDLAPLATQAHLRWLHVYWGRAATLAPLSAAKDLAWLSVPLTGESAATLPTLPALHTFTLGFESDVADVAFVARFPSLTKLDLGRNHVRDLTAIAAAPSLVRVEAELALVERLPAARVPSLRFLDLRSNAVAPEELRAFVDANPACEIVHDWRAAFVARTAGADGLRIRDTMTRDRPLLRFETHDADLARGFLDLVRIDDRASGRHCCCIGEYQIDVLRGPDVAASFTIHHASALRAAGFWPGDAHLTADSAEAVSAWLVAHGVDEESPRTEAARVAAEAKARDAAQDALLGRERAVALRACPDEASVAALLAEWTPEPSDRIVLAVRFLAIHPSNARDAGAAAYDRVDKWLDGVEDPAALAAAFDRLLADESVAPAAARSFESLDSRDGKRFPAEALPGLRLRAARILLASRSENSRVDGVEVLCRIGDTPEVRAILLDLLPPVGDDGRPVSPTTDSQMEAASGVVSFCDPSMFPRLQALADGAKDSRRWAKHMTRWIAERRAAAEADAPAPPK